MSHTETGPLYEFGPFQLDPRDRLLRRAGEPVPLTRKVLDVLVALVERHGELVLKEDLLRTVWPDTFVSEANLTQAVFVLRKALGTVEGEPPFIRTVAGKGYQFTARVRVAGRGVPPQTLASPWTVPPAPEPVGHQQPGDAPLLSTATPAIEAPGPRPAVRPGRRTRRWGPWLAAAVLVALVCGAAYRSIAGRPARGAAGPTMVAVLPFANLTGEAAKEYLSDGFTEEMIGQLGAADPARLGVIARSSVMSYKGRAVPIDQIARELGVQYVLDGSVRTDDQRVRITAQLVRASDRMPLWSRQYDRDPRGLLAIEAEIAGEIAREIRNALGDPVALAPAPGGQLMSAAALRAYDLHLKGRHAWNTRTSSGLEQSVRYFEEAIAADPGYVPAHAGLADAYALMSTYNLGPAMILAPKARAAALRAVELDPTRAEAHASLGLILSSYDWDWRGAEAEFRRAIALDPNYATAHHWYAEFLAFQGRFHEALASSERARRLDPLALSIAADHGAILYYSRQYDRAIAQLRRVLAADPAFPRARVIVYALVETGRFAEALEAITEWRRLDDTPLLSGLEAYVHGRRGERDEARRAATTLEEAGPRRGLDPNPMLAVAYAGMGDRDEAIARLQRACREHSNVVATLKVDPVYDALRSDARFRELLRLVGLETTPATPAEAAAR